MGGSRKLRNCESLRELGASGYEIHQTRGKTKTARRSIDLDTTTLAVLEGWRAYQSAEFAAVGIDNPEDWVFTDGDGESVHPQPDTVGRRRNTRRKTA